MCGELSTRRRMKSASEPCISDATARKKATPSTIPESETMLWRGRASRCLSAIVGARPSITAPPLVGAHNLPGREPWGRGCDDSITVAQAGEDLDLARILGAHCNLLL